MAVRWQGSGDLLRGINATSREWAAVKRAVVSVQSFRLGEKLKNPPCTPLDHVAPFREDPVRNQQLHIAVIRRCKELGVRFAS